MSGRVISDEYISLEDAKISIISALHKFHPELGKRASEILYHDDRMNVVAVMSARTNMMQCRPAGLTLEHLRTNDMYFPDYEARFGPDFTDQDNSRDYAIIDYEYDGSPSSVVYLAHELGHAIADDIQREHGRSYKDFTPSQAEEQAYFIQSIYSHYTGYASAESSYREELDKGPLQMSWERVNQYENAGRSFERGLSMKPEERQKLIVRALGGCTDSCDIAPNSHKRDPVFGSIPV